MDDLIPRDVAMRIHARRRALERFGVELDKPTIRGILQEIWSGTARFRWRTNDRVSVFETTLAGMPCLVAYDREFKQIVTFMKEGRDDSAPGRLKLHREEHARQAVQRELELAHREVQCAG